VREGVHHDAGVGCAGRVHETVDDEAGGEVEKVAEYGVNEYFLQGGAVCGRDGWEMDEGMGLGGSERFEFLAEVTFVDCGKWLVEGEHGGFLVHEWYRAPFEKVCGNQVMSGEKTNTFLAGELGLNNRRSEFCC
jgi:hypothetical protein